MKALRWYGKGDVRVENVSEPKIMNARDAIVKITSTAICGSDLHLLDGYMPTMEKGDILGHEFMGEIVDLGESSREKLHIGQRVVVPFTIACGECRFCEKGLTSSCDRSNPNASLAIEQMGQSPSGLFGYSHLLGGFSGGQAEYVRVPFSDFGAFPVPDEVEDEDALFLSDILPTGYMAAENAGIEAGDTVAVWGCGPVGQFTIQSAWMFSPLRVIAIDHVPERLAMARTLGRAETIDFMNEDVYDRLMSMTEGKGPDCCIDAVGCESHGRGSGDAIMDKAKAAMFLATDRPHALREAITCCSKGGRISVPGVYISHLDNFPMGAFVNKGLSMKSGQTHVHRYMSYLMDKILNGELYPSKIITHRLPLDDAAIAYQKFRDKEDGCIKVVLKP